MLNKNVVEERLTKTFANRFLNKIVYENFMAALPIDKSTISENERHELACYTSNIMSSLGGIDAVEAAIDIQHKSPYQNLFIAGIYNTCMESAKECAKKKCVDEDICSKEDKMSDVLAKASLSKEDCRKFAQRADTMKFDDVAEIIKKKTLQVISDEKEQFKKEQDLDSELEQALSENDELDDLGDSDLGDDMNFDDTDNSDLLAEESGGGLNEGNTPADKISKADQSKIKNASKLSRNPTSVNGASSRVKAIESFKDFHLSRSDPKHHISMFSRLQDNAMEAMSYMETPNYGRDYFPILKKITFESLFDEPEIMVTSSTATESSIAKEEICEVPAETRPKVATLVSIITYTIMETLHTMGIFSPNKSSIQKFVDTPFNADTLKKKSVDEACNGIRCAVKESANQDFSKMSSQKLGYKLSTLKTAFEGTQDLIENNGANTELINIASEAVAYISEIEGIMNQRVKDHQALSEATESFQTKREKEHDLAQFNRINGLFKANPNISEIQLCVNPHHMQSIVDIQCANESGKIIRTSSMNIEYACEGSQYLGYLDDMYKKSNLSKCGKNVSIKVMDGKGTIIKL